MHGHMGERKEVPNYVSQTSCFCCASATPYLARLLWIAHRYLWLTSFGGQMVIYAFFLGFFSPSAKKSDNDVNDKRLTKLYKSHNKPQSSYCLVVHEDAYLSYRRYKVKKPCFNGHLKVHKYQYTQTQTVCVCVCVCVRACVYFKFPPPLF